MQLLMRIVTGVLLHQLAFSLMADASWETDDAFLDRLQRSAFDYFWKESNPKNGLVRDRTLPNSKCSIAAVGFALSAINLGIEHGWITRTEGRERVLRTLRTFVEGPQGPSADHVNGYRGWYYHFLEMETGHRAWKCELSSIDTALLLAGVLDAREFFNSNHPDERQIRLWADLMVGRVDWNWMAEGMDTFSMGWHPESGFLRSRWVGYNEAMILYILALGAADSSSLNPPTFSWAGWTRGYHWSVHQGLAYVGFAPLFGHQYSHCWVDFRGRTDDLMRSRNLTYFENSRRATLAQWSYCKDNPGRFSNYGPLEWGITACDGPKGYEARGAPPAENDDGTLAPTAVGGSLPFAPEICLPTLRHFDRRYHAQLWGAYGFRDSFNIDRKWYATDTLGIDQGPILLMIENYRTGSVWLRLERSVVLARGLHRAGFHPFVGSP